MRGAGRPAGLLQGPAAASLQGRSPSPAHCWPLQAVLVPSEQLPEDAVTIKGWDFNDGASLDSLLGSMLQTGLQATALGQAIHEVNRMVRSGVAEGGWGGSSSSNRSRRVKGAGASGRWVALSLLHCMPTVCSPLVCRVAAGRVHLLARCATRLQAASRPCCCPRCAALLAAESRTIAARRPTPRPSLPGQHSLQGALARARALPQHIGIHKSQQLPCSDNALNLPPTTHHPLLQLFLGYTSSLVSAEVQEHSTGGR